MRSVRCGFPHGYVHKEKFKMELAREFAWWNSEYMSSGTGIRGVNIFKLGPRWR